MTVTLDTIATELGLPSAPDVASVEGRQWAQWIADARMLIAARLGDINKLDALAVDYVVRLAVAAHARRPDDQTQVDVKVDDGQVTKRYASSKGRVNIIEEWWELLSPTKGKRRAFGIDTVGAANAHLPWCSASMGAAFCSCGVDIAGHPIYEGGEDE